MSTIIKASESPSPRPVDFAFDDLGDAPRAELETQASSLCRQAEPQGTADATLAADRHDESVEAQTTSLLQALGTAVEDIRAARAQWLAHWETAALQVATAIAARIVRREVERTPDVTIALVKEALELAGGGGEVQLHMHPDDLASLGSQLERLLGELGTLGDAKVVADPEITRGGCRVDTRLGTIDQQFESQLARITQELT